MIGFNCKYAPLELFAGFGEECFLLNDEAENFDYSNSHLHPNMCSHAKAMLQEINKGNFKEIILTDCCDSSRRVFDALNSDNGDFSYLLDLPSCDGECAVKKFSSELVNLIEKYEKYSGKKFDKEKFFNAFEEPVKIKSEKFVALMGARSSASLLDVLKKCSPYPIVDLTCAANRSVAKPDVQIDDDTAKIMLKYASSLLRQTPCMRMQDNRARRALAENENCEGIVYHTVKFCDYYDFEYSELKNLNVPIIKIETDFTKQSYGQLLTRLEGFCETLGTEKKEKVQMKNGRYFAGVDSGSTSTELVVIDKEMNIVKQVTVRTGANAAAGARKALEQSGVSLDDIACLIATGYGRKNIDFADGDITEITCHAAGAKFLWKDVRNIIDIGGQDSKVICLDQDGRMTNFIMNDKCAAGTGRFLENMAKVLETDMDTMAKVGLDYHKDLTISSMCTVFAESEVVSLIAENNSVSDIVHGLNKSVAAKTKALAGFVKDLKNVMMTGGVARNSGVVSELEKLLDLKLYIPEYPECCGALGAAVLAARQGD